MFALQELRLIPPTVGLKTSFLAALEEFQREGLPWHLAHDAKALAADFGKFVSQQLARRTLRSETCVPQTELWAVLDHGEYVGRVGIRHELNDRLKLMGGHIGYDTRPSLRGRGIATGMLKAALPVAKSLGLSKVLLTCDDTNLASIRVIEKNGGVLEKTARPPDQPRLKRYYWISLD